MTSGSTGEPKGVALDFRKMALNASATGAALGLWRCSTWAIEIDLALMSALCHMLMAWQYDCPLIHLADLEREDLARTLGSSWGFGGSPGQLQRLHERVPSGVEPRLLASSGDFLTPQMIDDVHRDHPTAEIHKFYGLTELSGRFCHMPHALLMQNKAAAGFPLPGYSARIVGADESGCGEIEACSPLAMAGYYRVGAAFEPYSGPWLATGDLGTMDPDGIVTVVGRSDDTFKVGGEKVDSYSIETVLQPLLKTTEFCVIGIDHPVVGRRPGLFISSTGTVPSWADITSFVQRRLPSRFVPAQIFVLEGKLPRLASGKIDRFTLRHNQRQYRRLA
jgi:acyl-CoA synthetase (AMP-forming)/AMP-acid ligase II